MIDSRVQLINILGGKCKTCGESDIQFLQLDHINDEGAEDRKRFKNIGLFYVYYLNHPEEAQQRLQVLCANHNWKKRYATAMTKLEDPEASTPKPDHSPHFLRTFELDGKRYVTYKESPDDEEPLNLMGCPNCMTSDWDIYHDERTAPYGYFLRCRCGLDLMVQGYLTR